METNTTNQIYNFTYSDLFIQVGSNVLIALIVFVLLSVGSSSFFSPAKVLEKFGKTNALPKKNA
jgi:hypothetical protein